MKKVKLSNSDLEVSPVCLGCWQFNDGKSDITWEGQDPKTSYSIVDKCFELGVNFFDTAEAYNNHASETVLGKALEGRRRDAIVATKFGNRMPNNAAYRAEDIERSLNESLVALQTDYIDLYQVHQSTMITDMNETVKELKRQQSLGKIRYYAVSNFGPLSLKEMHEAGGISVTNQLPYNLLWRAIEYEVTNVCDRYNVDILAYSPLQQGLLTGKFPDVASVPEGRRRTKHFKSNSTPHSRHGQDGAETETFQAISEIRKICKENNLPGMTNAALSWLIAQPRVASVITGASKPEQMQQNCQLVELSQKVLIQFNEVTQALKEKFGSDPDMWAKETRIR
ncbi:putative oxidoreductase YqkF [Clavelina lepadiformis]|uniref:putative oxidoreductase YqkF n=1 Tax=Clavelina lepadiformis TaxID=159417 RepID=UPI00404391F7